jgi:hypothetical protein
MSSKNGAFSFNISLSVLNHLGRNLYRSFTTVLGEAISNSWDADAKNVYITIDRNNNNFSIKDDGIGMDDSDFSDHFLKVGYSKRKDGSSVSTDGRPYIGRKGIGKLALLSCSNKIHIVSKKSGGAVIGGIIDNAKLDEDIKDDSDKYDLELLTGSPNKNALDDVNSGTFLFFEGLKDVIYYTSDYLKIIIALYFRFSTIDSSFNIYVNGEKITVDDLQSLIDNTEFIWIINNPVDDPFLDKIKNAIKLPKTNLPLNVAGSTSSVNGFIVSVDVPSNLTIRGTDETVTVDLFVNGRLREKDIMKHIRTKRVPESYIYGQINYDSLDGSDDPFTSSRESIKEDNPEFKEFLKEFRTQIINKVMEQWDELRDERGQDGDVENQRITKKERKAKELFNATSSEYTNILPTSNPMHDIVDKWNADLRDEASFNFPSYAECFIAENLSREYIAHKSIDLTPKQSVIDDLKTKEAKSKAAGGVNIDIRKYDDDKSYLEMAELAELIEQPADRGKPASLTSKLKEFKPIRNALMHTALLSNNARAKLTSVFDEIKARIKSLLK